MRNDENLKGAELNTWFNNKLKSGEFGERQIIKHMIDKGWTILETNNGSEWDIRAINKEGKEYTVEVKSNIFEFKNHWNPLVVIETESNGIPSGLSTTTADLYILYYPFEQFFFIEKTEDLRKMIKDNHFAITTGGRKDLAKMYQIDRAYFKNKVSLNFMDYLDEDTKNQEWWTWYEYKYLNNPINLF